MRIAYVADVHVGNHKRFGGPVEAGLNRRCRQVIASFAAALDLAVAQGCEGFVVAGDLFDSSDMEPQVLAAVLDVLRRSEAKQRAVNKPPLGVAILVGNHDQNSDTEGDHALGVLRDYAYIVERPQLLHFNRAQGGWTKGPAQLSSREEWRGFEMLAVPFATKPGVEVVREACEEVHRFFSQNGEDSVIKPAKRRALCVHLGIADEGTAHFLKGARDSIDVEDLAALMDMHGYDEAFAGNWHDRRSWPIGVYQVGALAPTGWDNPGLKGYGGVAVYDTEDGSVVMHTVPGPRFVVCNSAQELTEAQAQAEKHKLHLYVRLDAVASSTVQPLTALIDSLTASGALAGGFVESKDTRTKEQAQAAAKHAASAETLEEALAAFVASMPLDNDVDRAEVARTSKHFLKEARA